LFDSVAPVSGVVGFMISGFGAGLGGGGGGVA
jgi:hypothetical protein